MLKRYLRATDEYIQVLKKIEPLRLESVELESDTFTKLPTYEIGYGHRYVGSPSSINKHRAGELLIEDLSFCDYSLWRYLRFTCNWLSVSEMFTDLQWCVLLDIAYKKGIDALFASTFMSSLLGISDSVDFSLYKSTFENRTSFLEFHDGCEIKTVGDRRRYELRCQMWYLNSCSCVL